MRQTVPDETLEAATELARLQGGTVAACVARAVRSALTAAQKAVARSTPPT